MVNYEKAIGGMSSFMKNLSKGTMRVNRGEAMNTNINNHVVDTVCPGDSNKWETGIKRDEDWTIVEQYKDMKEATKGHSKWVKLITENPNCELKDIDMWGLDEVPI